MIKVMWFLKRKDGVSLAEFRKWWLVDHVPDIIKHQSPYLKRYTVDIRIENDDLPGMPAEGLADWDGIAEQWFETRVDFEAVYGKAKSPTRGDTVTMVSHFQRIVVEENVIDVKG
jgi:hypothetical protein